ncbi:MAG: aminotransferase class V-fold PLP-dependent enzyme [Eubacteriales bacterium]|nr:aminotransferase class V-fold PLP-dependent enzyme [Eubacteriales bacterium]
MIYLNNAATSWPKAEGLAAYMGRVIDGIPVHGSRATGNGETVESMNARQELAKLMGISDSTRISYMENGTHGLNTALLGYAWKEGDVILTSAAEHNSVLRPLWWLKKNRGVEYVILPVQEDGRIKMKCFQDALQQYHPKVVVITHASNVTGAVNPLEEITALAHEAGSVVLADACQSLGIVPVLPQQWGVDMLAFTGHKYLLGPQGTGGLYVREGITLDPVVTGGTGIFSDEEEMPSQMPLRLEAGTQNEQGFQGLGWSVNWLNNHPLNTAKLQAWFEELEESLQGLGVRIIPVRGTRTPVLSFTVPGYTPEEIGDILYGSYDIICRTGLHCAPLILPYLGLGKQGSVRISMSRFTTRAELEAFLQAIKEIVSE